MCYTKIDVFSLKSDIEESVMVSNEMKNKTKLFSRWHEVKKRRLLVLMGLLCLFHLSPDKVPVYVQAVGQRRWGEGSVCACV